MVHIEIKRFKSVRKLSNQFKTKEVEVRAEKALETVWGRIQSRIPNQLNFSEVGIRLRKLILEAKVTMPMKDVENTPDWPRDPEELVYDCVQQYGATRVQAARYTIADTRPGKTGHIDGGRIREHQVNQIDIPNK
jgi:hypothetical protein